MSTNAIAGGRRTRAGRLLALAGLAAASTAGGLAVDTGVASAAVTPGYGYVWADSPTAASYTPSTYYQANSKGGTNTIVRESTGVYLVTMPGLGTGEGGNVHVTAYGSSGAQRCKVGNWYASGSALQIRVRCFNGSSPADSQYTVHHQAASGTTSSYSHAWLWADQPSNPSLYTASPSYSWNSTGQANTVLRTGTGTYTVTFPGQPISGGNVQVTAYGSGSSYCKVAGWGGTQASVACYTASGSATDSMFTVNLTNSPHAATGPTWTQGAYVWGNNATSTTWYTPLAPWTWNSRTVTEARKVGTGLYEVKLYGQVGWAANHTSNVIVTGYGSNANTCRVSGWYTTGSGSSAATVVSVRCLTPSGSAVDNQFSLLYSSNVPV